MSTGHSLWSLVSKSVIKCDILSNLKQFFWTNRDLAEWMNYICENWL